MDRSGQLHIPGHSKRLFLAPPPLSRELVGMRELDDDCWLVSFAHIRLGVIRKAEPRIRPFDAKDDGGDSPTEALHGELSPMLP